MGMGLIDFLPCEFVPLFSAVDGLLTQQKQLELPPGIALVLLELSLDLRVDPLLLLLLLREAARHLDWSRRWPQHSQGSPGAAASAGAVAAAAAAGSGGKGLHPSFSTEEGDAAEGAPDGRTYRSSTGIEAPSSSEARSAGDVEDEREDTTADRAGCAGGTPANRCCCCCWVGTRRRGRRGRKRR